METLGMLVLESDGAGDSNRHILLKQCTQDEARVYAEAHKADKDAGKRRSEIQQKINGLYRARRMEAIAAEAAELDADEREEAAAMEEHHQRLLKRKAAKPNTKHRYAWYAHMNALSVLSWETKYGEDDDQEEDYG